MGSLWHRLSIDPRVISSPRFDSFFQVLIWVDVLMPEQFLEVACKSSGKRRRFAAGTEAGFAVRVMNKKLEGGSPFALYIEAVKEGEEGVAFGPNSALVDYGSGWRLQTFTEEDYAGNLHVPGGSENHKIPWFFMSPFCFTVSSFAHHLLFRF